MEFSRETQRMHSRSELRTSRRRFLKFLAASPLLVGGGLPVWAQRASPAPRPPDPAVWAPRDADNLIGDPRQALDVFEFEPVMKKNVPPAHFGYMATGIDDDAIDEVLAGMRDADLFGNFTAANRGTPGPGVHLHLGRACPVFKPQTVVVDAPSVHWWVGL